MKKLSLFVLAVSVLFMAPSCSKDDPIQEEDQEEVGGATLIFTEVEAHGDHYDEVEDPVEVKYTPDEQGRLLEPAGFDLHLHVGATYRLELKATDYAGRETQQTFIDRDDIHQVFLMGIPEGTAEYVYADEKADGTKVNVGVTGYLTIKKATDDHFTFNYLLRHLNSGVKANIKASDWNNQDYTKFTGENDLDLKVKMAFAEEGHDDDDHDHDHE